MALIGWLVGVTIFILIYAMSRLFIGDRLQVGRRVLSMAHDGKVSGKMKAPIPRRSWLQEQVASVRFFSNLENLLRRADMDLSSREFVVRFLLITVCISLVALLVWGALGAVLAIGVAFTATVFYLLSRVQKRVQRFNEGLHDMLTLISSSLRSGHSFVQAMHVVSIDMQGPIQEEFRRIEAEMQVGVSVEEAMQRANERIGSEDFELIVTAIGIQRQVGGNLSEVLDRIADTIRERVQLKREVKALTSQGRMSAWIFLVLPGGVGALLYVTDPSYISPLFQSTIGWGMLSIAVIGQVFGYLIIRKIINVEL